MKSTIQSREWVHHGQVKLSKASLVLLHHFNPYQKINLLETLLQDVPLFPTRKAKYRRSHMSCRSTSHKDKCCAVCDHKQNEEEVEALCHGMSCTSCQVTYETCHEDSVACCESCNKCKNCARYAATFIYFFVFGSCCR